MIKLDRTKTLNLFARCIADTIQEWSLNKGYETGMLCFFHSFGENLQFHPHFHFLVTAGGLTKAGNWYKTDGDIPGHILVKKFKAKFSAGMKKLFREEKLKTNIKLSRVLYQINHTYDKHWQFYTSRVTRESSYTMLYCIRYAKKMILSEKRIIDYNGKEVTFFSSKGKVLVYDVMHFIKTVVQHIPEKYFRLIRYYGFYSNKSWKKYNSARKYHKPLDTEKKKLTWQIRQWQRDKKDPLLCPKCGNKLELSEVIYPEPKYKRTYEIICEILGVDIQKKMKFDYG